eukprot:2756563-Prymnesium_polylepis.1
MSSIALAGSPFFEHKMPARGKSGIPLSGAHARCPPRCIAAALQRTPQLRCDLAQLRSPALAS